MKLSNTGKAMRRISAALKLIDNPDILSRLKELHSDLSKISRQESKARPIAQKRKPKTVRAKLYDECTELWQQVVKARAGYKSEINCHGGIIAGHHILGKSNWWLRFDTENGICLTTGQHYRRHYAAESEKSGIHILILKIIGTRRFNRISLLIRKSGKPDLGMVKIRLQAELKSYGG